MKLSETKTTCPYCGVGCGVLAAIDEQGLVSVRGDPDHPANFGRLCSKGAALADTLALDGRLLYPEICGDEKRRGDAPAAVLNGRVSWDVALDHVAGKFKNIIAQHGPDAVAFYVSGQMCTEDYYVANKLMKGFIGSANIDTNSRLCMSSAVSGYKRAFGSDTVPCSYEDLELADLIVLVGSNTAWCHPVLFQRIRKAREQHGTKIVVIDPRRTATCEFADIHLSLQPGTDTTLFNGLLNFLRREDFLDLDFLERHTEGFAQALQAARDSAASIPEIAVACGVDAESLEQFYRLFASTEKTVTFYSQGVNQSSSGVDKVNSIINCHLATGRIGKPGAGPFSITGQPNAMGGREVGGLANQLAAHMDFDQPADVERVARFWNAAHMAQQPGLKAVDMFEAVASGKIKAVWIMATNPAVSLPDANRVREALSRCEFVVVSDCVRNTDTTAYAHVLLPAAAWGEKDGTVTNSERRISRQRAFLAPPGAAKPDWWIITELARRMGFGAAFEYQTVADVFREHARLSAFENSGQRDFDLSALAQIDAAQYAMLQPLQWPVTIQAPQGTARMFSDNNYFTPSRKARFIPIVPRAPEHAPDAEYPLVLNTGRVRDHWHTMTRTGKSSRLCTHEVEPYVEMHPRDAQVCDAKHGALARIESRWGRMIARIVVSEEQRMGSVFVPIHWNDQFASSGCVDALVNPALDPISGQPEFKHTPVRVTPYRPTWYGFLISRRALHVPGANYWVRAKGQQFYRHELAGEQTPDDWGAWARALLCAVDDSAQWSEFLDRGAGRYRAARMVDGDLESCLFVSRDAVLPSRSWLAGLFAQHPLTAHSRANLLAGKPAQGENDGGEIVCACFSVGVKTITQAIADGCATAEQIGARVKAGTNCGSCIPELKKLLAG